MKKILLGLFLFASFVQAAEKYTLDPNHTYVSWQISHFGFSHPSGKWMAQGTLMLDEAVPAKSQVNANINVGSVVTGIPELDEHLRGPQFFDVAHFPQATFVSDKVEVTGSKTAQVHGILTLHGVSKPVTLNVMLNRIGMSIITGKKTVGFSAEATLKRSAFGMTTLLPGLGDEVALHIEAEATKS